MGVCMHAHSDSISSDIVFIMYAFPYLLIAVVVLC